MSNLDRPSFIGLALVMLATACWATSGIFINWMISGSGISAVCLAFWRDFSMFLLLVIGFGLFRPALLKVKRRDLPWLAAMGVLSIGAFHALWNTNVMLNGASVATVIQCNAPIFVTLMAWMIWREPITSRKIAAIGMAVVGMVLIARLDKLSGMQITLLGQTVGLFSATAYGTFSLFGKKLSGSYNTWTILIYTLNFSQARKQEGI